MGDQTTLRIRLHALMHDYGTTTKYISIETKIDRSQLNKFKLGKLYLEPHQADRLDKFLSVRGYDSTYKAFQSVVQGKFD